MLYQVHLTMGRNQDGFGLVWLIYGIYGNFQQYFSHIVAVGSIGGGNRVPGESHRPVESHR
jgi:hypothetical protein